MLSRLKPFALVFKVLAIRGIKSFNEQFLKHFKTRNNNNNNNKSALPRNFIYAPKSLFFLRCLF